MDVWRLAYFNLIAGGYSLLRRPGAAERDLVSRLLRLPPGECQLLEVGSGPGYHARHLLRHFPHLRITASEPALFFRLVSVTAASVSGLAGRLSHREEPVERLPFPSASFDAGLCLFVLWAVEDREAAVAELARVIKPGGRLVLADFALPATGAAGPRPHLPFGHAPLDGPAALSRLVAPHFTVVETVSQPAAVYATCRRNL